MNIINSTSIFNKWLISLKDEIAKARIASRIEQAVMGNFGDTKSVGGGVFEMRIAVGKGYRVYYARQGDIIYLLISGGDKSTQEKDIKNAKAIWESIKKN